MSKLFKQRVPYKIKKYLERTHRIVLSRAVMDRSDSDARIIKLVDERTMTGDNRILNLLNSVEYLVENKISGSYVECGVWRGGSILAMAYKLLFLNVKAEIWAFDTFQGTPRPTNEDYVISTGDTMHSKWRPKAIAYASIDDFNVGVKSFLDSGIDILPIQGDVRETLLQNKPPKIALLRIDTDIYEAVGACLEELWPLVSPGGVVIIDDYDHWAGARKATDEYFLKISKKPLLMRMDTGRILIKQ